MSEEFDRGSPRFVYAFVAAVTAVGTPVLYWLVDTSEAPLFEGIQVVLMVLMLSIIGSILLWEDAAEDAFPLRVQLVVFVALTVSTITGFVMGWAA